VPRRTRTRSLAPVPLSPTHDTFTPYGLYGVGDTPAPTQTVAEKLAPGPAATRASAHTPPPSHSGGTSGNLTVAGYQPATPTGAPYDPAEPGHSAEDFAKAEHAKLVRESLAALTPLRSPGYTNALDRLAGAAGQSAANPLQALLSAAPKPATATPDQLLAQVPQVKTELPVIPHYDISAELKNAAPAPAPRQGTNAAERAVLRSGKPLDGREARADREALGAPGARPAAPRAQDVALRTGNAADPLGAKTLGDVTEAQLAAAAKAGTLHVNGHGVLTTPQTRQVLKQLVAAHRAYQATNGIQGDFGPDQLRFIKEVAKGTGLSPLTIAVQAAAEEGHGAGSPAAGYEAEGENNFLNLGPGQHYATPQAGAAATVANFLGPTYSSVEATRGQGPAAQLAAIEGSPWDGDEHYAGNLQKILHSGEITAAHNPQAAANLQTAQRIATQHGINPTPWNGDVAGGDREYVYVRADAKGAVDWARSALGTQEGSPKQRHWAELEGLGPSEPWCSDFVSVNLARRGVELPSNPNYSGAYEDPDWKGGTQLGTDISKAKPGDLVVYGGGAHIAMYVGEGKVVAGNWGDEVAEYGATEDSRGISAIVRPDYKGGKVKVKAGALPGSSSESTFGGGGESTGVAPATGTEAVPVSTQAQQEGQAALAGFTPLASPDVEAEFGQEGEAEKLFRLLTQASSGLSRA
jgi:hypothetical protein